MYIYWLSCGEHLIKGAVKSGRFNATSAPITVFMLHCSEFCAQTLGFKGIKTGLLHRLPLPVAERLILDFGF